MAGHRHARLAWQPGLVAVLQHGAGELLGCLGQAVDRAAHEPESANCARKAAQHRAAGHVGVLLPKPGADCGELDTGAPCG